MSSTHAVPPFKMPIEEFDDLCERVRLHRVQSLPTFQDVQVPAGAALWKATYAYVLLWPVTDHHAVGLRKAAERGQQWIDNLLTGAERKTIGFVTDGYLVLVLREKADDELASHVRRVESSTQVCRKHVVWWDNQPKIAGRQPYWHGLMNVSVVALPPPGPAGEEIGWPQLDSEAEDVWRVVHEVGHAQAARQDIERLS
jgi:hypothetical protein